MERFFHDVLRTVNVPMQLNGTAHVLISDETPRTLRQAIGWDEPFTGRFDLPVQKDEIYLGRTSPVIEGLASWTLDQALDPESRDSKSAASRCGAVFTSSVTVRTTLLVTRFRYHLRVGGSDGAPSCARKSSHLRAPVRLRFLTGSPTKRPNV